MGMFHYVDSGISRQMLLTSNLFQSWFSDDPDQQLMSVIISQSEGVPCIQFVVGSNTSGLYMLVDEDDWPIMSRDYSLSIANPADEVRVDHAWIFEAEF